jgi:hypothetical protein
MLKNKVQSLRFKVQSCNLKLKILIFSLLFYLLPFTFYPLGFTQEEFVYDSEGRRDPFLVLVTPDGRLLKLDQESKKGLLLEGIIYDKNSLSYAIVNGTVVRVGEKVEDYQVLKIEKNKVLFIKKGQITEIQLKEGE